MWILKKKWKKNYYSNFKYKVSKYNSNRNNYMINLEWKLSTFFVSNFLFTFSGCCWILKFVYNFLCKYLLNHTRISIRSFTIPPSEYEFTFWTIGIICYSGIMILELLKWGATIKRFGTTHLNTKLRHSQAYHMQRLKIELWLKKIAQSHRQWII